MNINCRLVKNLLNSIQLQIIIFSLNFIENASIAIKSANIMWLCMYETQNIDTFLKLYSQSIQMQIIIPADFWCKPTIRAKSEHIWLYYSKIAMGGFAISTIFMSIKTFSLYVLIRKWYVVKNLHSKYINNTHSCYLIVKRSLL